MSNSYKEYASKEFVRDAIAGVNFDGKQDALSFDGEYNAETNKVATVQTVTDAIDNIEMPNIPTNVSAFTNDSGYMTEQSLDNLLDVLFTDGSVGLKYGLYDDYAEIIGIGECIDGEVVIGSMVSALPVTSIGANAFDGCSSLTSITIPDSITSVGYRAFFWCKNLTSAHITDIAAWCGISFEDSSSTPLYSADNLYLNGELVMDLVIPEGVTSIGNYVFKNCRSLTSITIPNGVTSIGRSAFSNCSGLTSVTIPDSVRFFGESAFLDCANLVNIVIPNGVSTIPAQMLSGCSSLEGITIPDSVTYIGYRAFGDCTSLTNVTIPDSVTKIESSIFVGCTGLMSITVDESNEHYESQNGNLYTKGGGMLLQYACGKTEATFVIPDGVTSIEQSAFAYCTSLTSVTIPNSATNIGAVAFEGCTSLTSIVIPKSVTNIKYGAFLNCTGLTDVYYSGTEEDWNAITIAGDNDSLTNATIHYNSEV